MLMESKQQIKFSKFLPHLSSYYFTFRPLSKNLENSREHPLSLEANGRQWSRNSPPLSESRRFIIVLEGACY
jgi:hypothetical protein